MIQVIATYLLLLAKVILKEVSSIVTSLWSFKRKIIFYGNNEKQSILHHICSRTHVHTGKSCECIPLSSQQILYN
uniref:Putative ovule protein n=1 Tax=Solanum chacoense TaxID=4108 RepID=A0A0V0GI33_SOLCH